MTGGTTPVPAVHRLFERRFGADHLIHGDEFSSVAAGLTFLHRTNDTLEEIDDEVLHEQQKLLDQRKLSKARTRSERGDLERTRLNYRKAAEHFAEAARLLRDTEEDARFGNVLRQAKAFYDQGHEECIGCIYTERG